MEKAKILYGASIWTGQSGERDSRPAALAIAQGRIAICGSLDECRRAFPGAQEHDMGGGFLMPGFNDNHLHVAAYGASQRMLSLRGLDAKAIIAALQERYGDLPANRLIIASGWDYDCVPEPTKILLDKAFPKHDVILIQFSGHAAWVNSRMLKKMKITASTPDPAGGVIVRDKDGQATGVLRDAAMQELQKQKFLRQHMRTTLLRSDIKKALEACSAMGICSVQDNTWLPQGVWAYRYLHRKGRLPCRVRCWSYASFAPLRMIMERWVRYIPNWVAAGPRKYFLDGTFSTSTALLAAPYEGQDQYGVAVMDKQAVREALVSAAREGRQAAFHAIGDKAVGDFLDVFGELLPDWPVLRHLRIRLEHVQLISPGDIRRMADYGVLAAVQPHAAANFDKDIALLGKQRAMGAYPYRSMLDAGVMLSFGSDIPGEATVHPLLGVQLAVCHPGKEGISTEEALQAYTSGSAWAEFQENCKGKLLPGYFADIAHLAQDPRLCDPASIAAIPVLGTMVGGIWRHRLH